MTVDEVFSQTNGLGKDYPIDKLPNRVAIDRLIELEYDDTDQISRLRVSGQGRLYGFRERERFYALWWDPQHEIYPSPKKHT